MQDFLALIGSGIRAIASDLSPTHKGDHHDYGTYGYGWSATMKYSPTVTVRASRYDATTGTIMLTATVEYTANTHVSTDEWMR